MPGNVEPPTAATTDAPTAAGSYAIPHIEGRRGLFEQYVLRSRDAGSGLEHRSKLYRYETFLQSLRTMAVDGFGADFKFDLWDSNGERFRHGLVNLAAFLANCMVER